MKKFKKYLAITTLAGILSCATYNTDTVNDNVDLDNLGLSDYYFLKNFPSKDYLNLFDKKKLKENLLERLTKKEHTYRNNEEKTFCEEWKGENFKIYNESCEQIKECDVLQLLKIYTILNSFENEEFCDKIGKLVDDDLKDKNHEHGGLVQLEKNKLEFKNYPSMLGDGPLCNKSYRPSEEYFEDASKGCFGQYHFHAVEEDSTKSSGPSGTWDYLTGDISWYCDRWAHDKGYVIFIITKLKGKNFNVDICLRDYMEEMSGKIIDLGNYSYK